MKVFYRHREDMYKQILHEQQIETITNNMRFFTFIFLLTATAMHIGCNTPSAKEATTAVTDSATVRLVTVDPGHFHAALVQKTMSDGIDTIVNVYAPEGPELQAHLDLIKQYNERTEAPTHWSEKVYTGNDFLERMIAEKKEM